jgi:hypothetical protein
MPSRRATQRRQQGLSPFVVVLLILVGVPTAVSLMLVALRVVNTAVLTAFNRLWTVSPALGVAFATTLCLCVSLLLTYGGVLVWEYRRAVTGYWLPRLRRQRITTR